MQVDANQIEKLKAAIALNEDTIRQSRKAIDNMQSVMREIEGTSNVVDVKFSPQNTAADKSASA